MEHIFVDVIKINKLVLKRLKFVVDES